MNRIILLCSALAAPSAAIAQESPAEEEEQEPRSGQIVVYGRGIDQIGEARSASQGVVGYRDFEDRPISRVGELVENVPGVIATQHSGAGKANQYFLRGFNLDHGTDFAVFVDGVPVNMRSHGHGQGYLDLNFLIPELIERIDYRKGPYFADVGDFSAAGTAIFRTAERLPAPLAEVVVGEFGYRRGLLAGSAALGGGDLLVGLEGVLSDGPWLLDEDLERGNALIRYSQPDWSLSLSAYSARWTSTDQIPERAVADGRIDRFGFVDADLGGETSRFAITGQGRLGGFELAAYALLYRLNLTSNFTYFLDDPVNGDEFQQRDRRAVFGGTVRHALTPRIGGLDLRLRLGADLRYDAIGAVGLYRSSGGVRTQTVREDEVDEYSGALFADAELTLAPGLRLSAGLRGDLYGYYVRSDLAANSGAGSDFILTPKLALAWAPQPWLELYANYGEAFHSNDARGATISIDPATGETADPVNLLARARGAELGARVETERFAASLVGFFLDLQSELVFVGDAGTTEPNDATRRYGVEATIFWRPRPWLTMDASAAFTHARFREVAVDLSHIPGAVPEVIAAGVTLARGGFSGSVRLRHFGAAPLTEDGSVRSDPTTLVNLGAYYRTGRLRLGVELLNLFNAEDADITYFYESRLPGEAAGVEDRHFHPVEPRQLRASVRLTF
jgi:outer membrane receptor protein involved in Fe transport